MESDKQHFRHILLFYYRKGKNAVQARKKLTDVYGEGVLTVRQCQNWFAKFRSGNFDVEDAPRSGRPVEADKDAIKALVDANRRIITTSEIGLRLNLSNSTVYDHLKGLGLSSKLDVWVPHVLTERNLCRRIDVCDSLLKRYENDSFLKRIITGDEKGHGAKKTNRLKPFPKPIFTKKREFDIAHSVVSRLWKSFKTTGMCSRRHGGGRVRSTTPAEDRYIVLSAERNRRTTAQQVANQFLAASGKQISRKTVARRLREGRLYARRPVVCVPLTRQHRTARLQWCREHHNWTEQDWACVLFSDESRFSLSSDCRRQLIWRESGTAYRPENIQEKDRYPTCSIMVWAGIMINGRTRLHVVANGTMTGQRYIDEVLLPHVRLFRGAVGDKFVFMDDNATWHRTLAVQDCLDSEGIQCLVWPARSPDLNPIENVWDALGRQVAGRNYHPTNKNTLIRALTEEWDKLPQQLLDNVVQNETSTGVDLGWIKSPQAMSNLPFLILKPVALTSETHNANAEKYEILMRGMSKRDKNFGSRVGFIRAVMKV
ncbi:histone-lysine N-methyltransferase SETMAR [Trichonephila clavipes]|nr:histone-lysine N-methyltransferase SETMAR [Trichonephila clavipes]